VYQLQQLEVLAVLFDDVTLQQNIMVSNDEQHTHNVQLPASIWCCSMCEHAAALLSVQNSMYHC
jgi:hypothetical protein